MKVLFVLSSGRDLATFPAVYQLARELRRRGAKVSIVTGATCNDPGVREDFESVVECPLRGLVIAQSIRIVLEVLRRSYDLLVAWEPRDAYLMAAVACVRPGREYAYDNLEVLEPPLPPGSFRDVKAWVLGRVRKALEKLFVSRTCCLVSQDARRRSLLKECGIVHSRTFLVPNTYYSQLESVPRCQQPAGRLLYTGSLERWALGDIEKDPAPFRGLSLTLSGWSRDGYIKQLRELLYGAQGVAIIEQSLSTAAYFSLVRSHDVGLVWYAGNDRNVREMGMSSGKFFAFLACGRPVIVQDLPGIGDETRRLGLGEVISSLNDIPAALAKVMANFDVYRRAVERAMMTEYDYAIASKPLAEFLAGSTRRRSGRHPDRSPNPHVHGMG